MNIYRVLQYPVLMLSGMFAYAFPLGPALAQGASDIEFKADGRTVKSLSLEELRAIAPVVSVKVFEAHENKERVYRAIAARPVFDKIFGKNWEKAQEIIFTSIDGYQPSIPAAKFLSHDAYLAFAHDEGGPFTMVNTLQNNENVSLGPLYLIWDNLRSKALLESGASDMPYQIKTIALSLETPYPNTLPPPGSSARVQRGFAHFHKYCISCHTINGEGGGKAPELNYPASVVEYIKPEYLKRWIEHPQSIRYNTAMPALGQEIPDRDKVADEIIVYLKVMSMGKRAPAKQ
ncbi:c-type cytochrome [Nitrosovibrio tenuis]|nr:cytochrome c [Nitrosovibrio tenuis]